MLRAPAAVDVARAGAKTHRKNSKDSTVTRPPLIINEHLPEAGQGVDSAQ